MFYTLCFLLALVGSVSKTDAGAFKALLYSDWIDCVHDRNLLIDVSEIQIFIYDFQNNKNYTFERYMAAYPFIQDFDFDRKVIVFVPGYKSHISKKIEDLIRDTFSDVSNSYLMIIDHSGFTNGRGGKIKSYERAVKFSYYIGKAIGEFLAELHHMGFPSKNIHCIGHSLGAQMLAVSGTVYTNLTTEYLWRITGIDPAGPCFSNSLIEYQIRSGVAEYVEVYHCNAGKLGTTSILADTDFFINKDGKKQPPCHEGIIPGFGESDAAKCSHRKCVEYWAKTVHEPTWYAAWKCDSFDAFQKGLCSDHETTIAGYSNPGNATGVFYVSTKMYFVE